MDANLNSEPLLDTESVAPAAVADTQVSNNDASDVNEPLLDELENKDEQKKSNINDAELLGIHGHIKNSVDEDEMGDYFASLPKSKQKALAERFPKQYGNLLANPTHDFYSLESKIERKLEVKQQLQKVVADNKLTERQRSSVVRVFNQYIEQGHNPEAAHKMVLGDMAMKGMIGRDKVAAAKKEGRRELSRELPSSHQQVSSVKKVSAGEFKKFKPDQKLAYKKAMREAGENDIFA